ncbi:MAG: NmrA family NAD(P)-binding protein [Sphingomonas sp.]|jgi:uncharacterized protein YbjT (DUF2867 family)|uniref:NmrA family NAD(P)-binding protein n=1 Tax=Sphingomonas sp. TaxID=28214 RepID=UPI00356272FF
MDTQPILIIGGAGKTGGRVDSRLRQRGFSTRLSSRSTPIPFDWADPASWPAALDGVAKAYVTYYPDVSLPSAAADIAALAALAGKVGLQHLVLLSGRGEPGAQDAEVALQASGVPWTIVRSSWFNQNFSEGYLLDGVMSGEIALPAREVPEPFVDVDDIADVVTAALTDARHIGKLYELTGPRAITFSQAVAEVSRAVGRPITYQQISGEDFAAGMRGAGVPDDIIHLLDELFTVTLDGRNCAVQHGVMEALGRPAKDFADYARDAAAANAWRI